MYAKSVLEIKVLISAKTQKMVHRAIYSCITHNIDLFRILENHAYTGSIRN